MGSDRTGIRPLRLFLSGYGKMGKAVADLAQEQGHAIIGFSNREIPFSVSTLSQCDVCIDFSHPEQILPLASACVQSHTPLVIGTTGWSRDPVEKVIRSSEIGCLISPNFSLGIALFRRIVEEAAELMNLFPEYDVGGWESHHQQKKDSPSGTARALADILLQKISRKKKCVFDSSSGISPEAIHFPSLRCGSIPGTHAVVFDSPEDTITLSHQARSRNGFALGALHAASWILERKGFFTMEDWLHDLLSSQEVFA